MLTTQQMLEEPEKHVPNGLYCYKRLENSKQMCPFWSIKEDLPEQENGFCLLLDQSDYDINEKIDSRGGLKIIYCNKEKMKVVDHLIINDPNNETKEDRCDNISAHAITASLLWDQCKECKVNYSYEEND